MLARLGWDEVTRAMLWSRFFDIAVAELLWRVESGRVVLKDILPRDPRRFLFDEEGRLRLRTQSEPMGALVPPSRF